MSLKNIPFGKIEKFNVIIEIPTGSQDKYEYDEELDIIKLDRVLFTAQSYPANYGFIPETLAEDGDHSDVLLLSTNPIITGAVVEARAIGFMKMIDSDEADHKVIAVPTEDPRFKHVESLKDIAPHTLKEIQHFFETYKDLQKKVVIIESYEDKATAEAFIEETRKAYQDKHQD